MPHSIEAKNYPFYATQWHPEKNAFDINPFVDVPRSKEAIRFSFEISQFFIEEGGNQTKIVLNFKFNKSVLINLMKYKLYPLAYKSKHVFASMVEQASYLIDANCPYFYGSPTFKSIYRFNTFP